MLCNISMSCGVGDIGYESETWQFKAYTMRATLGFLSFSLAHLSFLQVVKLMVESSNVAEYLGRNVGTNGVLQDLTGLLIHLEGTLDGKYNTVIKI